MKTFNNQTLNEKVIAIVDLPYLDYTDDKIKGFILKIACHNEEVDDDDVLSLEPNNSSIILIHVTLRESEDGDDFDSIMKRLLIFVNIDQENMLINTPPSSISYYPHILVTQCMLKKV